MKVLVLGGGGREHAIAWRLHQSPSVSQVFVSPGNPGSATIAKCVTPASTTPEGYMAVARAVEADLTVVGPEAPLVDGTVDLFQKEGLLIFGPTARAAQLEGSKIFSKRFMERAGIPTARFVSTSDPVEARAALNQFTYPVVIKADGLAAGKGVVICPDQANALETLEGMFSGALVGAAGASLVIEEFLTGEEVSFIGLSDGQRVLPLEPSQDHKTIYEGDQGPNTGGMGAYSDSRIITASQREFAMCEVMDRTIQQMAAEGNPFQGFLYAGLMMTPDRGPMVLEFNVRLGDPETQALLHRMDCDFGAVLFEAARGQVKPELLAFKQDPSVCVVLAAHGYPGKVRTGDAITGIAAAEATGATVFHAGTKFVDGKLVASGGRVLGVTHSGPTLQQAIANAYQACDQIHFDGMQIRRDIGKKGLKRWA
ncbi:MAG: phosphoribosylamine--glycine ligase [Acidobacteria bacterium]|nr:phosphoribosylamine--glycine ligase [Acidobacteriota bacterium]